MQRKMYFPLLFQVISSGFFLFTPAEPTVLNTCPDLPVICTYTLRCLLSTNHARGSIQSIHLSAPAPLPFSAGLVIAFIF